MKKLFLLILPILLMASTCREELPVPEYFMNPEAKEYMFFRNVTWWQYIDTATGESRFVQVISDSTFMYEIKDNDYSAKVFEKREAFKWTTGESEYFGLQIGPDTFSANFPTM